MKARHIRKLRKQVQSFQTFRIMTSCGAFGDFFYRNEWEFKEIRPVIKYMLLNVI